MNLLKDDVRSLYFRYFRSIFGSSIVVSVYSLVDSICIGQYEGPDGSSACAVMGPMWYIMLAAGIMLGVGGSVLLAQNRGAGRNAEGNRYFTICTLTAVLVGIIIMVLFLRFMDPILTLSGASDPQVRSLTAVYMRWISLASPMFVLTRCLSPFVSNDGAPTHAAAATIAGGVFNVFGDLFLVFGMDMGIEGAGIATAAGQTVATLVMLSYLLRKKCTLRFDFSEASAIPRRLLLAVKTGASSFLLDISLGILGVIFNNQIMIWLGTDELAVYGVISNVQAFVIGAFYAVGDSAQPIMSQNYGAGQPGRIREAMRYAAATAMVIGVCSYAVIFRFPLPITRVFMTMTDAVRAIAPMILRTYFAALLFMGFNILASYFFQSVGRPVTALISSLLRGVVICGILLLLLPPLFGGNVIWMTVPLSELAVLVLNLFLVRGRLTSLNKSGENVE